MRMTGYPRSLGVLMIESLPGAARDRGDDLVRAIPDPICPLPSSNTRIMSCMASALLILTAPLPTRLSDWLLLFAIYQHSPDCFSRLQSHWQWTPMYSRTALSFLTVSGSGKTGPKAACRVTKILF